MSVAYERTGGFVGLQQRLEIDAGGQLKVTDRRAGEASRALTAEERATLQALTAAVEGQRPPGVGEAAQLSDAFTLQLWLGGQAEAQVTLTTVAVPLGQEDAEAEGVGTPWGRLLSFVDGLLTKELDGLRPPGAPRLLNPEEL